MMDNYIEKAMRSDNDNYETCAKRFTKDLVRLLHAGMGLETEAGEFIDMIKRHTMYGADLDVTNLKEELGDVMWYVALACDQLGTSIEEVMQLNISKLQARYPHKFTEQEAQCRDLVYERKVMEAVD